MGSGFVFWVSGFVFWVYGVRNFCLVSPPNLRFYYRFHFGFPKMSLEKHSTLWYISLLMRLLTGIDEDPKALMELLTQLLAGGSVLNPSELPDTFRKLPEPRKNNDLGDFGIFLYFIPYRSCVGPCVGPYN